MAMPPTNAKSDLVANSAILICPKCGGAMEKVTFGSTEVDRCEGCGGLWFDRGEKERLAGMTGTEAVDAKAVVGDHTPGDVRKMQCPRCQGPMVTTEDPEKPGIEFEICQDGHGTFFDAGEFKEYKQEGLAGMVKGLWRQITHD